MLFYKPHIQIQSQQNNDKINPTDGFSMLKGSWKVVHVGM